MIQRLRLMLSSFCPEATSRRIAVSRLRQDGMRLHLVLASVICLSISLGTLYLAELTMLVIPWQSLYDTHRLLYSLLDGLYYLVDTALIVFIVLPLLFGAARIFDGASRDERVPLSEIFSPFRSGRSYARTVLVMLTLTVPRLLAFWLVRALWLAADGRPLGTRLGLYALAAVLLLAVSLLLTLDDAVLPMALRHESLGLRALWRISYAHGSNRMLALWRFKLGYLGWCALSILSLGTVLILHALPLYTLAHAVYTDEALSALSSEKNMAHTGKSI